MFFMHFKNKKKLPSNQQRNIQRPHLQHHHRTFNGGNDNTEQRPRLEARNNSKRIGLWARFGFGLDSFTWLVAKSSTSNVTQPAPSHRISGRHSDIPTLMLAINSKDGICMPTSSLHLLRQFICRSKQWTHKVLSQILRNIWYNYFWCKIIMINIR